MQTLISMTHNYILNAAIFSWVAAQVLKFVFTLVITGKRDVERLLGSGGMPSSHSAMVCALTVAVARSEGIKSPVFALAFVFACIVMYDAMGVRRQAGEHAKIINRMIEEKTKSSLDIDVIDESGNEDLPELEVDSKDKELKEILGHTPLEVLGGALLGIIIAMSTPL